MKRSDAPDAAPRLVERLRELITPSETGPDRFEAASEDLGHAAVFGGQLLGQALMAAARSVDAGRAAHSMHAYFLRAAKHAPIVYEVQRVRDGRSFSHRRVTASQNGRAVFEMCASFQSDSDGGISHQAAAPVAAGPDGLPSELDQRIALGDRLPECWRLRALQAHGIEYRQAVPIDLLAPAARAADYRLWLRVVAPLPDDPALHRALLAYASDNGMLRTPMLPHGLSFMQDEVSGASLDHAIWFHADFRIDDWLLHSMDSPIARGGRALCRGSLFTRDGRLVASTVQEGVLRVRH